MNPVIEKLTGLGIIDESDPHEHALFISNRRITERFGPDNQQEQSTYEQVIADVFGIEYHAAFRKEAEMMLKYMLSETVRQYVEGAYVDVAQVVDVAKGMLDRYMIRFPWVVPGWKSVGGYITPADGERVADGSTSKPSSYVRKTGELPASIDATIQLDTKPGAKAPKGVKAAGAKAIYDANPGLSTKEYIAMFVAQLNMSTAGARTYLYNIKKESAGV
jgi:hypothetical protein